MNEANFICLNVTYNCNCRCDYCFAYDYDVDRSVANCEKLDMTLDEIKRSCEFLAPDTEEGLTLGFFGGEPMTRFDLIFDAVSWARPRYKKLKLCATTNATLLNDESAQFFADNDFSFVISMDGMHDQHNQHRKLKRANDGDAWKRAMAGLDCLKRAYHGRHLGVTLRGTFVNDEEPRLVERLKFLNQLVDQGYGRNCSVEPAVDRFLTWTAREEKKFRVEYAEVADWWLEYWRAGKTCTFHHFDRLMPRLFGFEKANSECGAGKRYLSVGPGGKIFACHRNLVEIGNIDGTWNDEVRDIWRKNTWQECRPTCGDCGYHEVCGGGCRANAIQLGLPLRTPPIAECALFKLRVDALRGAISRLSEVERIVLRNRAAQRKNSIGKGNQNGGHKGVCRRNVGGENDTANTEPVRACFCDRPSSEHESQ